MKVRIVEDEWYPVYDVSESSFVAIEYDLPETLIKRLKRTMKAFSKVQSEIQEAIRDQ